MAEKDGFPPARMDDLLRRAQNTGIIQYTTFLDPAQRTVLEHKCQGAGLAYAAYGGYEEAERAVAAVGAGAREADFPVATLKLSWDKRFGSAAHHDILGALMALGVARERFGDILASDGFAYVFALKPIVPILCGLTSAGRAQVHVSQTSYEPVAQAAGRSVTATFRSLRLDAIVAEAMRIPRPDAVSLAAQGRVLVNYQPCLKNDAHLNAGDVISIRGMGRVILKETGGKSKKDRIYLTMEVFSRNQ